MSDLIERLRHVTEEDAYALPWTFGETCREAADRISALENENAELRLSVQTVGDQLGNQIERLMRQVEELRADCQRKDELLTAAVDDYNDARCLALEEAACIAYRTCAETRHVTLGDKAAAAIRRAAAVFPQIRSTEK